MRKDHSQVPVAGAGGSREHFWVPANAGNPASVFCRSGWDVAEHARGCWAFRSTRAAFITFHFMQKGAKHPWTPFKDHFGCVMPMWQQLDTVIKMLNHCFSAACPLSWDLTAGIHLPICDQQQQEGDTAGISESKPLSSYPQQGAGVLAQSSPAVVFIIGNVHERRCPESFLKISFPHSL